MGFAPMFKSNIHVFLSIEKKTTTTVTTAKDEIPVRVYDFVSLQVFAEWCQNVPKWATKIVKTLNFDWLAENVFVTRVDR